MVEYQANGVILWAREPQNSTEATETGPPVRLALSRALEGQPPTLTSQISRLKIEAHLVIALEPVVVVVEGSWTHPSSCACPYLGSPLWAE